MERCPAHTQPAPNEGPVLFENVRIFDGQSDTLSAPSNVLIEDGKIATISTDPVSADGATAADAS